MEFGRQLPREFYERDTLRVARELLGKVVTVSARGSVCAGRIVETEAYHGKDPAAHCARGPTDRCRVMFGQGGVAYVYFIYGNHEMLNFVTERPGYPGAVLIRALEPLTGLAAMRRRRGRSASDRDLTAGPGKLCSALGIRLSDSGRDLCRPGGRLGVFDDGMTVPRAVSTGRIGIRHATERRWRFYIPRNPFVSVGRR